MKQLLSKILCASCGKKTIIAGIGLIGLAIYQLTTGDYDHAIQNFLAALAALGIRHAISQQPVEILAKHGVKHG